MAAVVQRVAPWQTDTLAKTERKVGRLQICSEI